MQRLQADEIYKMEREFYDFAVAEFDSVYARLKDANGTLLPQQFHYEKIRD